MPHSHRHRVRTLGIRPCIVSLLPLRTWRSREKVLLLKTCRTRKILRKARENKMDTACALLPLLPFSSDTHIASLCVACQTKVAPGQPGRDPHSLGSSRIVPSAAAQPVSPEGASFGTCIQQSLTNRLELCIGFACSMQSIHHSADMCI